MNKFLTSGQIEISDVNNLETTLGSSFVDLSDLKTKTQNLTGTSAETKADGKLSVVNSNNARHISLTSTSTSGELSCTRQDGYTFNVIKEVDGDITVGDGASENLLHLNGTVKVDNAVLPAIDDSNFGFNFYLGNSTHTWSEVYNNHLLLKTKNTLAPKISINGSSGSAGQVLTSTGSGVEWASAGGSSGNKEVIDFTGKTESDYLSNLTGSSNGVVNQLFNGEYVTIKSAVTTSAGRVMTVKDTVPSDEFTTTWCNGNVGEEYKESQALGVLLEDVVVGDYAKVAVKGICSVLCGASTTAQRGCLVTLGGSASSWAGTVVCTSRVSNEPSVGICLSDGSKSANQPIVVFLQHGFESY